jgi:hypothetical protein
MKKIVLFLLVLISLSAEAKKIKFSVDMSDEVISPFGIHVAGDFQQQIGNPKNWLYDATSLKRETADTNIYSIVLDLKAFRKYEFKFVNGDQDYEVEFIPVESRVGYGFVTNRWIYVDSLDNGTMDIGAIQFAKNAPKGLKLMRCKVNMSEETAISVQGVHFAGNFQGWDPKKTILYSFGNKNYEIITYVKAGNYEYKYLNGNTNTAFENVPNMCAKNNNRYLNITNDTVFTVVCYAKCIDCKSTAVNDVLVENDLKIIPNPSSQFIDIQAVVPNAELEIYSVLGQKMLHINIENDALHLDIQHFPKGMYVVRLSNHLTKVVKQAKLTVE